MVDNSKCEQAVTRIKVRLFREILAVSSNGTEYFEKCGLMKRKVTQEIAAHQKGDKIIELPIPQVEIKDKYLDKLVT